MTAGRKMDNILSRSFWGARIVLEIGRREQVMFFEVSGLGDPLLESKTANIPSGAIIKSCDFGLWL